MNLKHGEWYWVKYAGRVVPMKRVVFSNAYIPNQGWHYLRTASDDRSQPMADVVHFVEDYEVVFVRPLEAPPPPPFEAGFYWILPRANKHRLKPMVCHITNVHEKALIALEGEISTQHWTLGARVPEPAGYKNDA